MTNHWTEAKGRFDSGTYGWNAWSGSTISNDSNRLKILGGNTGALSRIDIVPNPIGATYGSDYDYTETLRVHGFTGTEGIDTAGNTLA